MNTNQIIGLMVLGIGGFYLYRTFTGSGTRVTYTGGQYPTSAPVKVTSTSAVKPVVYQNEPVKFDWSILTDIFKPSPKVTIPMEPKPEREVFEPYYEPTLIEPVPVEKPYMSSDRSEGNLRARGIRNNNPGNIKKTSDNWQGAVGVDGPFVVFSDTLYGIRAIAKILQSYRRRGIVTLSQIISVWAPPDIGGDNNPTLNYINSVSRWSGINVNHEVDSYNMIGFIAGIIRFENGDQPYAMSYIQKGISMA